MNSNVIETYSDEKFILYICTNEYAEDPRKFCDHDSVFITRCRNYNIGDICDREISIKERKIALVEKLDAVSGAKVESLLHNCDIDHIEVKQEVADIVHNVLLANTVMLSVYMLDHSGIRLSTSDFHDQWDSGCIGFIYIEKKHIPNYGIELPNNEITDEIRVKVQEMLKSEIEEYDGYVSGNCYEGILYKKEKCPYCHGRGQFFKSAKNELETCRACNGKKYLEEECYRSSTYYGYSTLMKKQIAQECTSEGFTSEILQNIVKENINE